jgi:hypothetical protein
LDDVSEIMPGSRRWNIRAEQQPSDEAERKEEDDCDQNKHPILASAARVADGPEYVRAKNSQSAHNGEKCQQFPHS